MPNKIVTPPTIPDAQLAALLDVWQCADLPLVAQSGVLADIVDREIRR
jgi:hypothetical protein